MNWLDKLEFLQNHSCSLHIEINEHRDYYQTIDQWLDEQSKYDRVDDETRTLCKSHDRVVYVQCYPNTPVGFSLVIAHSIEMAVEKAWNAVKDRLNTTKIKETAQPEG